MANHTETTKFLQVVFPDHADHAIFAYSLTPSGMAHTRDIANLSSTRDCYWSVAAFPADTSHERNLKRALGVRALVIDDVGTKVSASAVYFALGQPTASIETSAGNFQWTYKLSEQVPVDAWREFFAAVEALVGSKLEGRDAVHLFRLPFGLNTKKGRGGFAPRLAQLNAGVELSVPQIMPQINSPQKSAAQSAGRVSGPEPRVRDILAIMDLIPNNSSTDYDQWVARAHQIKALARDETEAEAAFDKWSSKRVDKYDPAEVARVWRSLHSVSRTTGLTLLADAEAAGPARFARIMNAEAGPVFDDNPPPPPPIPPSAASGPRVKFKCGKRGDVILSMDNTALALKARGIACVHDEFHHKVYLRRSGKDLTPLTDHEVMRLRVEFLKAYGVDFGPVHIGDAVVATALQNGFNPVVEMLADAEALWDGAARLDRLGPDYFHTEDSALARECFRKVMIAAVRRARRPGVKFDQILVVESPEGWNKSSAWEVLAGTGNFSDAHILGKDARAVQEELADIWIHEIADLSGLARTEVEQVKAFASRTNDRARAAYGRFLTDQPRQSIEVGTTNSDNYLLSQTGNRRFWPFKLRSPVDLAALRADRLALWGEAAAAESLGETLVLDAKLWAAAGDAQEARRVVDTWEDELGNLVEMTGPAPVGCERIEVRNGEQFISNLSVQEYLAGYRRQSFNSGSGRKISDIMKRLGWERTMKKVNGAVMRGYKRTISTHLVPSVTASVTKKVF